MMCFIRFNANSPLDNCLPRNPPPGLLPPRQFPLDNCPQDSCPTMKFLPGQLPLRDLPVNNPPCTTTPQTIAPYQVPPWTTNEKCFQLSRFEFELHLSEASIATRDLRKGGIVNPLLASWLFCAFFSTLFRTHF